MTYQESKKELAKARDKLIMAELNLETDNKARADEYMREAINICESVISQPLDIGGAE